MDQYRDIQEQTPEAAAKRYKECLKAGHKAYSKDYPPAPATPDIAGFICEDCKIYCWVDVRKMISKLV
jgi:hypothetical protein